MLRNHQEKSEVEKEEEEEAGNHGEGIVFPLASLPVESAIRGGDAGRTLPSTRHVPVELNAGLTSVESCSYWKKRGGGAFTSLLLLSLRGGIRYPMQYSL